MAQVPVAQHCVARGAAVWRSSVTQQPWQILRGEAKVINVNKQQVTSDKRMWWSKREPEQSRTVWFNQPVESRAVYDSNEIRTTKYTPFSFLPKNLLYQFRNIANSYFLFLIILGAFQIFGVASPGMAAVPLIVIVVVTAVKDALEDSRRTISDLELNNTTVSILHGVQNHNVDENNRTLREKFNEFNSQIFVQMIKLFSPKSKKELVKLRQEPKKSLDSRRSLDSASATKLTSFTRNTWKNLKVGDVVRIHNNEEIPADLVILSTSDDDNRCFVETKNLDGETNLKSRIGVEFTSNIHSSKQLLDLKFKINSEPPTLNLYKYNGSIEFGNGEKTVKEPLSINNMLLRGSTLRNTKWCIGIAIFTGHETKVMLNAGKTPSKRSRISKELNLSVIINFCFLFVLCFVSAVVNGCFYNESHTSFKYFEYGGYAKTAAVNGIISFFVSVILLQALVPISLYISVEIIKTVQAVFIHNDIQMYDEKLDYPCTPKSWNISDDLGQIEYIFTDKTGTLTQNIMEFKKCTVNGEVYGLAYTEAQMGVDKRNGIDTEEKSKEQFELINKDKQLMIELLKKYGENPHFNEDQLTFISSQFIKDLHHEPPTKQSELNFKFILYLSICHTVLTEPLTSDPTKFTFKAESPDEAALVQMASDLGCSFIKRTKNGGILLVNGVEKPFEIMKILEFNSTRKRMSVIVKLDDKITLISKGADSTIFKRLSQSNDFELINKTANNLEVFANEGLRTLCVAYKDLSLKEFIEWEAKYDHASGVLENREEEIEKTCELIESDLTLIGGTAIEDRLQEGVPESIATLRKAGIKLWVLTGDKIETAINIGFSCNLLGNDMSLLTVTVDDENLATKLDEYLKLFDMTGSEEELEHAKKDHSLPNERYAIIIDGDSLHSIFEDKELQRKFLLLCKQCGSVLCCRVSPAQKAQIVKLVKDSLDVMTLSIGDGANDVSMIQTANVGVGIVGEEGRQASMASDYAIGQFKFLTRLILVHGRWSYKRLSEMIPSFFYKNVAFTLTLFWYGIYNNFDGSYLFEYTFIMFFNLAFTSLPIIFLGIFDQDVSDVVSLKIPQLYKTGILRQEWSQWKFIYYMIDGLYQSVISFYFPILICIRGQFATYNGLNIDHRFWIGVMVVHISVTTVNIYILLRQYRWDWLSLLINALSILVVFFWDGIWSSCVTSGELYKAAAQVYGSLTFWAVFFVGVLVNLLPRFVYDTLRTFYRPKDIDIIRECVSQGFFHSDYDTEKMAEIEKEADMLSVVHSKSSLPELVQSDSLIRTFTANSKL